jgi:hypothetical protein
MVTGSKDKTKLDVVTPDPAGGEATTETITFAEYDMRELKKYAMQQIFTLVLMCGIHYKYVVVTYPYPYP